jgi:hypothetical protein
MPPSYRERLRVEGLVLAACGALASVALVAFVPASRRWPLNTAGQLAVVAVLLEGFGTRRVRKWLDQAEELPPVTAGLAAVFVLLPETGLPGSGRAGWDAGLRITGGCLLVGLTQGLRFERIVGADESKRGRRYLRVKGSHLWSGTKLGWTRP